MGGKARDFIPLIKLLIWNKLDESYSIDKLPEFVPQEMLTLLGFENSFDTSFEQKPSRKKFKVA
jgi:hypothetical protein